MTLFHVKQKLLNGRPVVGIWNTLNSPKITQIFSFAGLDFQIIDFEHGPLDFNNLFNQVMACTSSTRCSPLLRIPANIDWMALQALDQGVHGLVIPHLENVNDICEFSSFTKYPPAGTRGFSPYTSAWKFDCSNTSTRTVSFNENILRVGIIESLPGLDSIDKFLELDLLDVYYFGAYDLSLALGKPGEPYDPSVLSHIQICIDKVNAANRFAGGFVPQSFVEVEQLLDMGIKFITYNVDSSILYSNVLSLVNRISSM